MTLEQFIERKKSELKLFASNHTKGSSERHGYAKHNYPDQLSYAEWDEHWHEFETEE